MVTHTKKATHSADYPSWLSKNNAEALAKPITNIVNSILTTGIYPNVRKSAEITPLKKNSNSQTCKDYRPMSLLFHVSKIALL